MSIREEADFLPATQPWMHQISVMQQSVLLAAIRGPDGLPKNHVSKLLMRWFRRCILISAFDRKILNRPFDIGERQGGSFTGPSIGATYIGEQGVQFATYQPQWGNFSEEKINSVMPDLAPWFDENWSSWMHGLLAAYITVLDEVPHHFQLHLMHAAEILGYKHPDPEIRQWWNECYGRLVLDMHLNPESEEDMDRRLGDNEAGWLQAAGVTAK